ncbi:ubiquitin carboxyl-terminal hydrolase 34 [Naviculisporaceae sp. PSN 640]
MEQTLKTDDPRERAVSSEPCSTRPNPFDDDDTSSRKRRRTSACGTTSRSRSVETVGSIEGVRGPAASGSSPSGDQDLGATHDSGMKIETNPAIPSTPEQRPSHLQDPSSGPRSSRVTINVRTPSRPLDAIPSSPTSPIPGSAENVQLSIEDSEVDMAQEDAAPGTRRSPDSDPGSSPAEHPAQFEDDDDEIEFVGEDPQGRMPQGIHRSLMRDPTGDFPFRGDGDDFGEAVTRLGTYLPSHENVSQQMAEWLDRYVQWARGALRTNVVASWYEHRELWLSLPELVMFMVNRPNKAYSDHIRPYLFHFYAAFARATALFVEVDLYSLRDWSEQQSRAPDAFSPPYVRALAAVTGKDEIAYQVQYRHYQDDFDYPHAFSNVLYAFQTWPKIPGGALAYLRVIARTNARLAPRFPKMADQLANLAWLASNVVEMCVRKATNTRDPEVVERARSGFARGISFFKTVAPEFEELVNKHVNLFTPETASILMACLTEIYSTSLRYEQPVKSEIIKEYRLKHPLLGYNLIPDAISSVWKTSVAGKLIMSSQMQLRVMAASGLCSDLVSIYRRSNDLADEVNAAFMNCIASHLINSGLVAYIVSPKCHPEVSIECHNIIGFLVVSRNYTKEHTDNLWATVTSTQDPRISDALVKMLGRIINLFQPEELMYFCEKLQTVPVQSFGATMREFLDAIFRHLAPRPGVHINPAPFDLCIRLVRQTSRLSSQSPSAGQDLALYATSKLKDVFELFGTPVETRRHIYMDCVDNMGRGGSDLGSLWVLQILTLPPHNNTRREMGILTEDYNLTPLLIEELEAAISEASSSVRPAVLSGQQNLPRRELLTHILTFQPSTIPKDLGHKFWYLLVGPGAASREDRDVAWEMLNSAMQKTQEVNPFGTLCFSEYLPSLPPDCFCLGTHIFVRDAVLPLVDDVAGNILDDEQCGSRSALEQLWRLVLQAPEGTIEDQAIDTLVQDVYLNSRAIKLFPHSRARKVHLSLVNRCLQQMSAAATRLEGFAGESKGPDDESMEIVATDQQVPEQNILFIRSLSVLKKFHSLYRNMSHFSAPDLRPIINNSPKDIEGESAELKYQSFDGDVQTDVMPLNIGRRNTAASLFASLREATGFDNYRAYYRGRPFVPQQGDICKSLEDLQIHNGIILVKRENDAPASPTKIRPGASRLEVEILSHFEELWEYLAMEEKLARQIYMFLIELPIDEATLESIENPSRTYQAIFSVGQPYKTMYAVHALRQYVETQHSKFVADSRPADGDAMESSSSETAYVQSLARAMDLAISALSDPDVISRASSTALQVELGVSIVQCLTDLFEVLPQSHIEACLDGSLLDRFLAIILAVLSMEKISLHVDKFGPVVKSDPAVDHLSLCLSTMLEACSLSSSFMSTFCSHAEIPRLLETLLIRDPRAAVRRIMASLVLEYTGVSTPLESNPVAAKFREFFWPFVTGLVRPAITQGSHSDELLHLCLKLFEILQMGDSSILDMRQLLADWGDLLLSYTTTEDLTQPEKVDQVAAGLTGLLHKMLCDDNLTRAARDEMQPAEGMARKLFWKHLFPDTPGGRSGPNRPILTAKTREQLVDIMMSLIGEDSKQLLALLEDLNDLVPVYPRDRDRDREDGPDFYSYELVQQFDRQKAVKSACGYAGLKNLSNTCYFNSLFTQLFMNTGFRQFMVNATVQDQEGLLFYTRELFAKMQASIRRSMDPQHLISSIRTYEDTAIDIHNQMDVDEFYNLLFDRWEAQLASGEERRQFRSFYGGQLVQQVKSKECEHISERLEPFSAIQCDIKGKASLEESLQAYVDGEIMEGDNKYKCSTCDRHVDAVKRACLKDVPDNLIFHLKRFDFNLRTLMRNKINDHFAFPATIDMQPYTIEHLSGGAEDRPTDIFELVGVLVHSGTAESGHYYSYVRERPSSSGSASSWVEFNDENVNSWDPANMEAACFGGHETNGINYSERTWSAYMLFYQRSTSLAKEQELLRNSNCPSPLKVDVPHELESIIQLENNQLLRRHCLYDTGTIDLVDSALAPFIAEGRRGCSDDHDTETLAITMALSYLDQVASRAKDIPKFFKLYKSVVKMAHRCAACSLSVYQYFYEYTEAFRQLVQRCSDAGVRQDIVNLLKRVLRTIRSELPLQYGLPVAGTDEESDEDDDIADSSTVMGGLTTQIFKALWDGFHNNIRSWNEVFEAMLSFVSFGRHETAAFLKTTYLEKLLCIIYADNNMETLPVQFVRMAANVSRRATNRAPSYNCILDLINVLVAVIDFQYTENGDLILLEKPEERSLDPSDEDQRFHFTRGEFKILHSDWVRSGTNIFMDKLIGINQNAKATEAIIENLMRNPQLEEKLCVTLKNSITGHVVPYSIEPYLCIAGVFFRKSSRRDLIQALRRHINLQCMSLHSKNLEGKFFFCFQRDAFATPRENSGESLEDVIMSGYDNLPGWAPGLLAYPESRVSEWTENFLADKIFKYGPSPVLEDTEAGRRRASKILESARMLGVRTCEYLNIQFVNGRGEFYSHALDPLQRVLRECIELFLPDANQDEAVTAFLRFAQETLDNLQHVSFNTSSENASGMFYSDSSSVASSNTAC